MDSILRQASTGRRSPRPLKFLNSLFPENFFVSQKFAQQQRRLSTSETGPRAPKTRRESNLGIQASFFQINEWMAEIRNCLIS